MYFPLGFNLTRFSSIKRHRKKYQGRSWKPQKSINRCFGKARTEELQDSCRRLVQWSSSEVVVARNWLDLKQIFYLFLIDISKSFDLYTESCIFEVSSKRTELQSRVFPWRKQHKNLCLAIKNCKRRQGFYPGRGSCTLSKSSWPRACAQTPAPTQVCTYYCHLTRSAVEYQFLRPESNMCIWLGGGGGLK